MNWNDPEHGQNGALVADDISAVLNVRMRLGFFPLYKENIKYLNIVSGIQFNPIKLNEDYAYSHENDMTMNWDSNDGSKH